MLHQRTKQLKAASETPLRYGWYLPNFTQKCFGCGTCEKACRSEMCIRDRHQTAQLGRVEVGEDDDREAQHQRQMDAAGVAVGDEGCLLYTSS